MRLEAVYNDGRLTFLQPVSLQHKPVRVTVEIPDEALSQVDLDQASASSGERLTPEDFTLEAKRILDKLAEVRAQAWQVPEPELAEPSEKQAELGQAYCRREDR